MSWAASVKIPSGEQHVQPAGKEQERTPAPRGGGHRVVGAGRVGRECRGNIAERAARVQQGGRGGGEAADPAATGGGRMGGGVRPAARTVSVSDDLVRAAGSGAGAGNAAAEPPWSQPHTVRIGRGSGAACGAASVWSNVNAKRSWVSWGVCLWKKVRAHDRVKCTAVLCETSGVWPVRLAFLVSTAPTECHNVAVACRVRGARAEPREQGKIDLPLKRYTMEREVQKR